MPNIPYILVHTLYYAAVGTWLGGMVLLAAAARGQPGVGHWIRAQDRLGLACGIAAALAALARARMVETALWAGAWTPQKRIAAVRLGLLALMILLQLYAGWSLHPEVDRLRGQPGFEGLHLRSVLLMVALMFAAVLVMALS